MDMVEMPSFKLVSLWCLFFDPHRTPHQSNNYD
jgi:hypothetical protein